MKSSELAPLLFTVYLAAASGRSPALPCFAEFLALVCFSGLFAFTQLFFQTLVLWSVFDFSFSTGMWAVSGLALSAVFPDIFVAFCAPVIMNYLLEFVSFEVDFFPDLLALSLTHTDISDNRAICAVYIISALTLLTVVFAFIFSKAAGRRIRNEMR